MPLSLRDRTWNPYVAGGLTGILLALSVLVTGKYFGASTTFVLSAGLLEQMVAPERVAGMSYFMKYMKDGGGIDWQWMFVLGVLIGSFISARLGGTFKAQALPDMWRERFGESVPLRAMVAFFGGLVLLFGARMAGGCPSGHGLSGVAQLALSGFLSLAGFFAGGIIVANLIYKRK